MGTNAGSRGELPQFSGREGSVDANDAVVDSQWVPPGQEPRRRQKSPRQRVAMQIDDNHRLPRRLFKVGQNAAYGFILKMMQE